MKPILKLFSALLSLTVIACSPSNNAQTSPGVSTSPSTAPSSLASGSLKASPNASASPSTTPGSNAVTATREAYAAYLGCMNEKHPDKGYAGIQQLMNSGVYDKSWSAYRPLADNSVKLNSDSYGKECGA